MACFQPGHGVTKLDSNVWLPYCCLRTNTSAGDFATLAHEIVHATGDARHIIGGAQRTNLMSEVTGQRADIYKAHIDRLAKAYFAK
ncbi:hypothetical protein DFR24_3979 [Panacagrimonas perspica]|uniref:Uncharacterized protein n=1 Tax=Panacagrimonas perspica TaxID=381431 RepID=A0A4R7NXG3_9GAMM|nr:hypothetical protein [Panacagrimonas perspica]TDU25542.1 hypothetical protein DFR24_3979 [Panacagrimonas perspica]THD03853.1 hypothetical protein B1810_08285 [Panacagrimonas perspica]